MNWGLWHYWAMIILMMIGLYTVMERGNLIKKIMGLSMFQVSVIMFYVAIRKARNGTAPIIPLEGGEEAIYANPLTHVLMLTAIVVGIATVALGLAITARIQDAYGTIEETEMDEIDEAIL